MFGIILGTINMTRYAIDKFKNSVNSNHNRNVAMIQFKNGNDPTGTYHDANFQFRDVVSNELVNIEYKKDAGKIVVYNINTREVIREVDDPSLINERRIMKENAKSKGREYYCCGNDKGKSLYKKFNDDDSDRTYKIVRVIAIPDDSRVIKQYTIDCYFDNSTNKFVEVKDKRFLEEHFNSSVPCKHFSKEYFKECVTKTERAIEWINEVN